MPHEVNLELAAARARVSTLERELGVHSPAGGALPVPPKPSHGERPEAPLERAQVRQVLEWMMRRALAGRRLAQHAPPTAPTRYSADERVAVLREAMAALHLEVPEEAREAEPRPARAPTMLAAGRPQAALAPAVASFHRPLAHPLEALLPCAQAAYTRAAPTRPWGWDSEAEVTQAAWVHTADAALCARADFTPATPASDADGLRHPRALVEPCARSAWAFYSHGRGPWEMLSPSQRQHWLEVTDSVLCAHEGAAST